MRSRITSYRAVFGGLSLLAVLTGSWSVADLAGGGAVSQATAAAWYRTPSSSAAGEQQQLHWQLAKAQASAAQARARAAEAAQAAQLQQASVQQASPTPSPAPSPAPAATQVPPPSPSPETPPPAPQPSGTGILTPAQVGAYWLGAGGPAWAEQASEAVAMCESGDNTNAWNPSGATGLWQILGAPAHWTGSTDWYDPSVNAAAAVAKFEQSGDTWAQWTCQP